MGWLWQDGGRIEPDVDIRRPDQAAEQNVSALLAQNEDLRAEAENLLGSLDAVSDVLMYEAVYQSLQGRFERGGAALEAAAGNARPPEIESVATPVAGRLVGHRVCLLFPEPSTAPPQQQPNTFAARTAAEPRLAAWLADLLGDLGQIGCRYVYRSTEEGQVTIQEGHLSLQDLGVSAIDVLFLSASLPAGEETEIEQRIKYWVRQDQGLKYDTPIEVDASRTDTSSYKYSLGEALELGQQVLNTLGVGVVLGPGALRVPAEAETVAHTPEDVQELDQRFRTILVHICELVTALGGDPIRDLEDNPICAAPSSDKLLSYTVHPGDTLEGLAERFGTTVEALGKINNLQETDQLVVGQVLLIPDLFVYQVKAGDTLWLLAFRFQTTIEDLVRINKIRDPNYIIVGQVLWIPAWPQKRPKIISALFGVSQYGISGAIPAGIDDPELRARRERVRAELQGRALKCQELRKQAQASSSADQQIALLVEAMKTLFGRDLVVLPTFASPYSEGSITYRVRSGDTLWDLSRRFGTNIPELARLNHIKDPNLIITGQGLLIPGFSEYKVKRGDTLPEIARRFRTTAARLKELNQLRDPFRLVMDQALFVPHDLLAGLGENRVRLWLQQAAEVRPPLRQLEATLMLAETWREAPVSDDLPILNLAPALSLHVVQLPFDAATRWVGLDDEERGPDYDVARDRGALSVVAALAVPADETLPDPGLNPHLRPRLAGLLLDQWDEQIPSETVQTGLSFQYDGPGSQAPQCLLLAVPSPGSASSNEWKEEELAEIVKDTMDLARVRAVDFDAICQKVAQSPDEQGLGLILPASLSEAAQAGWEREAFTAMIDDLGAAMRGPVSRLDLNFAYELHMPVLGTAEEKETGRKRSGDFILRPLDLYDFTKPTYSVVRQGPSSMQSGCDIVIASTRFGLELVAESTDIVQLHIGWRRGFQLPSDPVQAFDAGGNPLLDAQIEITPLNLSGVFEPATNFETIYDFYRISVATAQAQSGIRSIEISDPQGFILRRINAVGAYAPPPEPCIDFNSAEFTAYEPLGSEFSRHGFTFRATNVNMIVIPVPAVERKMLVCGEIELYFPLDISTVIIDVLAVGEQQPSIVCI